MWIYKAHSVSKQAESEVWPDGETRVNSFRLTSSAQTANYCRDERKLSLDKLLLRACIQSQEQSLKGKGSPVRTCVLRSSTARTPSVVCYSQLVVVQCGQRNSVEECHQLDDLSHNLRLIEADATYSGHLLSWVDAVRQRAREWRNHAKERSWRTTQNQRSLRAQLINRNTPLPSSDLPERLVVTTD